MLEKDMERYERNAARILSAIDHGRVPGRAGTDSGDRAGADPD